MATDREISEQDLIFKREELELRREELKAHREDAEKELNFKREELELRREELKAHGEDAEKSRMLKFSPAVTAAIFAAVLSFIGGVVSQICQGIYNLRIESKRVESNIKLETIRLKANTDLENQKFRSSLILKALEAGSNEEAAKSLSFFVDTGLLTDDQGKISAVVKQPNQVPRIEPIEKRMARLEIQLSALECQMSGRIFNFGSMKCTQVPLGRDR